jgi:hypothetical protein
MLVTALLPTAPQIADSDAEFAAPSEDGIGPAGAFELPLPDENAPVEVYASAEVIAEEDDTWSGQRGQSTSSLRRSLMLEQGRFLALGQAIRRHPDALVNYVFRGELLLDAGERQAAAADFNMALALAEKHAETLDWGYISGALADRARLGLRRCGNVVID